MRNSRTLFYYIMLRLEDLNLKNLKVYQDDNLYTFTSDAILLSKFAKVKSGDIVADYCAGSGIVGFNLLGLNSEKIKSLTAFELQKPLYDLCVKSIEYNNIQDKVNAENVRLQELPNKYHGKFSLIVCNPPYAKVGSGETDKEETIAICRTELKLTLSELVTAISKGLKFGGRVCLVHRADRLSEVTFELQRQGIEPKRLQLVESGEKEPYLFMLEAVKGGKTGLKILKNAKN